MKPAYIGSEPDNIRPGAVGLLPAECEECGTPLLVGPKLREQRAAMPGPLLCFTCAVPRTTSDAALEHLGKTDAPDHAAENLAIMQSVLDKYHGGKRR